MSEVAIEGKGTNAAEQLLSSNATTNENTVGLPTVHSNATSSVPHTKSSHFEADGSQKQPAEDTIASDFKSDEVGMNEQVQQPMALYGASAGAGSTNGSVSHQTRVVSSDAIASDDVAINDVSSMEVHDQEASDQPAENSHADLAAVEKELEPLANDPDPHLSESMNVNLEKTEKSPSDQINSTSATLTKVLATEAPEREAHKEVDDGRQLLQHNPASESRPEKSNVPHHNGSSGDQTGSESAMKHDEKPQPVTPTPMEVIELLDSDDDGNASDDTNKLIQNAQQSGTRPAKRPRTVPSIDASYPIGAAKHPSTQAQKPRNNIAPYNSLVRGTLANLGGTASRQPQHLDMYRQPLYLDPVPGFIPTWKHLMPYQQNPSAPKKLKAYQLTLLNVSEFTITGLHVGDEYNGYMTSTAGLRSHIKHISKGHGNAFYERDPEGDGKWHIPLGAYHAFYGFLKSDPMCRVEGISEAQLKIASLGKARLEKDYPSARKLMSLGVPPQLATALAPFQRGGVDFVTEKEGRALIADEMGLGKTIQAIASMSVYHEEWPLLVVCPSSARYHWQNEFRNWLGKDSSINDNKHAGAFDQDQKEQEEEGPDSSKEESRPAMPLLERSQIHVLTAAKDDIFPTESTLVVICSYGLVPNLIKSGKFRPGTFKCAIVDESHMLKNKKAQRTSTMLPILSATNRCILLSGTPAFARPMELWPQLMILGTERHGWWQQEGDFVRKYVRGGKHRRAELHTMLMGTVMIRRMKNDILKSLPAKVREQGIVDVMDESTRQDMQECMASLRMGKGKLSELARQQSDLDERTLAEANNNHITDEAALVAQPDPGAVAMQMEVAAAQLQQDLDRRRAQGQADIRQSLSNAPLPVDPMMAQSFMLQMETRLEQQLHAYYQDRMHRISTELSFGAAQAAEPPPKKAILNHMYTLTGKAKVPLVVDMLKRWLKDPTKGKLCLFAHHISVLDAIAEGAGLSNRSESSTKFIRIDGSTMPRARQEQINTFQGDPSVRIALLGITAAGVAVTLTAASTVWFAELFWTPAICIQAEDRCHRIGQQAEVHCLYFVAKGTIDELLWKLLENKFEALGEFVEGQEKMKMVVNKKYHTAQELVKSILGPDISDYDILDGEQLSDANSDQCLSPVEEMDSELVHEIEELGLTEQQMLNAMQDDDDSDPEPQADLDAKPAAKTDGPNVMGRTENEAICLSDSDDDNEVEVKESGPVMPQGNVTPTTNECFDFSRPLPRMRVYKLNFNGPKFGLHFTLVQGRLVVSARQESRLQLLGAHSKPHVGDILAAINRQMIPIVPQIGPVVKMMRHAMDKGPVEMIFAEDSEFSNHFQKLLEMEATTQAESAAVATPENQLPVPRHAETNGDDSAAQSGLTNGVAQPHKSQNAGNGSAQQAPEVVIELIDDD